MRLRLLRDSPRIEQVGEIAGVNRIVQEWSDVEDFLHGTEIGRMREIQRARVRKAVHIPMRARGDDNLADRVIEVVAVVARNAVTFRFIPPQDDRAVVFVGV